MALLTPSLTLPPFKATLILLFLTSLAVLIKRRLFASRTSQLPESEERVVVLGSTRGIGRSIAVRYAKRGAKICIVGRRAKLLEEARVECCNAFGAADSDNPTDLAAKALKRGDRVVAMQADVTVVDDMLRVRQALKLAWGGIDTVIMCAGVSSLSPLLEAAGVHEAGQEADAADISRALGFSDAAMRANMNGPLISALALIPLLETSSKSPAIALISSGAAIIPAPTRSLYCASKAASLLLYQTLAIEHPSIKFTFVFPSTVEGNFRDSAVDGGHVREADPDIYGLKREYVAKRCISAVDAGTRNVFLPWTTIRLVHFCYWLIPGIAEYLTAVKYRYPPSRLA